MPFIRYTTTKTLTLNQEKAIKEVTGKLISILPNKLEENLMIHIEDNQLMYFKGKDIDCMKIQVQLFHTIDLQSKQKFVKELCKEIENITHVPLSQQYLSIEEYENWGKNGELV